MSVSTRANCLEGPTMTKQSAAMNEPDAQDEAEMFDEESRGEDEVAAGPDRGAQDVQRERDVVARHLRPVGSQRPTGV